MMAVFLINEGTELWGKVFNPVFAPEQIIFFEKRAFWLFTFEEIVEVEGKNKGAPPSKKVKVSDLIAYKNNVICIATYCRLLPPNTNTYIIFI